MKSATAKLDFAYPALLDLFREHLDPKRSESASFLIWYLENYFRLDTLEAIDCVCDQPGDKGVDGIYINDEANTIDVFQSKISQKAKSSIGDTPLKDLFGTLAQFKSKATLEALEKAAGHAQLGALIKRLDLANKVESYTVRGIFVSNIDLDGNGAAYLKNTPSIRVVGRAQLTADYVADSRPRPVVAVAEFDIAGFSVSEYIVDKTTKAIIAPVRAKELVKLAGIGNQSLFAYNVRASLGRTQVNRDVVASIREAKRHKLFPLFHNGITVICRSAKADEEKVTIHGYNVVNGCQSLTSLFENAGALTDDLRILTKFVQVPVESELANQITLYSNNQNSVKARDFKSNDPIQIRLQNEIQKGFRGAYHYEIKRGEAGAGETISNEDAGLYLLSFDLKEPWATHRKYKVFDEKHAEVFGRPQVTADRVVFLHEMMQRVAAKCGGINNKLFGKYALTRFLVLFLLREVLESDPEGKRLIANPRLAVQTEALRKAFSQCIDTVIDDLIVDINGEVDENGDDFDYRGKLRDEDWVKDLSKAVVGSYIKLIQRKRVTPFGQEWLKIANPGGAKAPAAAPIPGGNVKVLKRA